MNKKYLILGIALLLAVGLTNMARANSFNDALNTLSNQLYWLRDRLTAQVQTIENPMGSHVNPYTWIKELDDKAKKLGYCLRDSDCYIPIDPQGEWCWTSSPSPFFEKPLCDNSWKDIKNGPGPHVINKKYTYYDLYGKPTPPPKVVPDINSLPIPPPCETWVSTMPSIGSFVPIKCNKGTCEVDRTKTINSKKYVILKEGGQCALKDLCKTDRKDVLITTGRQFVFDTLEDCNLHKEGKLTVAELRRQRDDLLKQLSTLQGKTTVPTLPNVNTVTELQAQIKQLLTEIAAIQASRRTTTTTNRLKYLCDSVKKTCTLVGSSAHSWTRLYNTKEECEDACKGTTTTTQPEAATDQWYKLTAHQGCNLDDFSRNCYGTNAAKNSGNEARYCMNQYLLSQKIAFSDLTVFINEPIEGATTCMSCDCNKPDIYIKAKTNIERELNKIGFTKASSPKMPIKAIKPQLKEQMMACSVDTECTFAETSCCDCSRGGTYDTIKGINKKYSTGFSKQLADYCRDNMIVCRAENKCEYEKLPMEAFVITSCVSGRCQIAISTGGVDTQPEKPTTPIEPIKNKTTVDLSQQELYYREDKDTNKIKYAIISSNDKSVCGDNICSLKENYLYKLDLTKSCSVYADKVINFSHCHQDCKNATDQLTGAGISKEEFNALELVCTSQPEKPKQPEKTNAKGMPQPAKPIAQMSQAEKNSYVMELQTFLIQLLTQLLNLMKK